MKKIALALAAALLISGTANGQAAQGLNSAAKRLDRPYSYSYFPTNERITTGNVVVTALGTSTVSSVTPVLTKVGSITTVAGAALVDGDNFTIEYAAGLTVPIEFDLAPGNGTTGGRVPYVFAPGDTADQIRDGLITLLNTAAGTSLTASPGGAATVSLVLDTPGAVGGTNTEAVANAGFAVSGFVDPTHVTTYGYKAQAHYPDGTSNAASAEVTTAAGHATLSASNYNTVVWAAVAGSAYYKLYRTTGGAAPPKLLYTGTATSFVDSGQAGTAQTPSTINTTGAFTGARLTLSSVASVDSIQVNTAGLAFTATSNSIKFYSGSAYDLWMNRNNAAGALRIGKTEGAYDGSVWTGAFTASGGNGSNASLTSGNELLTLATGSTTTPTVGNLLPANAQVLFITGRVTTTITTAVNYTVAPTGGAAWVLSGTATTSLTGLAAGSTFVLVPPSNAVYTTSTANTITVTTNANPGAGAIRLVPFYVAITPPAS